MSPAVAASIRAAPSRCTLRERPPPQPTAALSPLDKPSACVPFSSITPPVMGDSQSLGSRFVSGRAHDDELSPPEPSGWVTPTAARVMWA
jgi:hypothetical protein